MGRVDGLFQALPKGSISEIIMERITDALISGELKPGDKIPTEVEFSEKLGISRNAVREAIKVLVAFGVLEIRRSEGTFVVDSYNPKLMDPLVYGLLFAEHSMKQLLDFKISIANSMVYMAMKRASDEELEMLRTYALNFKEAMTKPQVDIQEAYRASKKYNEYLGSITKNPMMVQLDEIVMKIAKFTRTKAMEESVAKKMCTELPDNYLREVDVLQRREEREIGEVLDERLEIWAELLL